MKMKSIVLADARTTNGELDYKVFDGDFGKANIYISGVFGGAKVQIQAMPNETRDDVPSISFVPVSGAQNIVEPQVSSLDCIKNTRLRAVVSNATGTTNISIIAKYYVDNY